MPGRQGNRRDAASLPAWQGICNEGRAPDSLDDQVGVAIGEADGVVAIVRVLPHKLVVAEGPAGVGHANIDICRAGQGRAGQGRAGQAGAVGSRAEAQGGLWMTAGSA